MAFKVDGHAHFVEQGQPQIRHGRLFRVPNVTTALETGRGPASSAPGEPRRVFPRPAEPVDLIGAGGPAVAKRVVPAIAALVVVVWLLRRLRG